MSATIGGQFVTVRRAPASRARALASSNTRRPARSMNQTSPRSQISARVRACAADRCACVAGGDEIELADQHEEHGARAGRKPEGSEALPGGGLGGLARPVGRHATPRSLGVQRTEVTYRCRARSPSRPRYGRPPRPGSLGAGERRGNPSRPSSTGRGRYGAGSRVSSGTGRAPARGRGRRDASR